MEEFDSMLPQKPLRTVEDYQKELLELFKCKDRDDLTFRWTPWVIGSYLMGWQMDVPQGHKLCADPKAFLEGMCPQIKKKWLRRLSTSKV